jgi:Dioxygenase
VAEGEVALDCVSGHHRVVHQEPQGDDQRGDTDLLDVEAGEPHHPEGHEKSDGDAQRHQQRRPVRGARVDLWQCNAQGVYSGVQDRGTAGRDFLPGFQVTDDFGKVRFVTVYPGWYPGRAVHIHAKVRTFDPYGEVTTETSTQLFFDDAVTDTVFETEPYAGRGPRTTRNGDDPILRGQQAPFVSVAGSPATGMQGRVEIGIRAGEIRRD